MTEKKTDYKTEPMTEEQYKHITELFFSNRKLATSNGAQAPGLAAYASYEIYVKFCAYTSVKPKEVKEA